MATYNTLTSLLTAIANAIRSKTGETGVINAQYFPSKIEGISTTPKTQTITKTITLRGSTIVEFTFNELTTVYGVSKIYRAKNDLPFCGYQIIKRNITSDNNIITINGNTVSFEIEEQAEANTQADWTVTAIGQ